MRLLVTVLLVLMIFAMLGFVMTNLSNRVPEVVLWNTVYPNVPLYYLVVPAVLAGALVVGIIAVVEGANTRLANRRLRREIRQLETEINYLRTQPPSGGRTEPDVIEPRDAPSVRGAEAPPAPASGPVYDAGGEGDDDDMYSGGRAV